MSLKKEINSPPVTLNKASEPIAPLNKEEIVNGEPFKKTNDVELVKYLNSKNNELKKEIAKVIVGHEAIIDQVIIAILSRGHCL